MISLICEQRREKAAYRASEFQKWKRERSGRTHRIGGRHGEQLSRGGGDRSQRRRCFCRHIHRVQGAGRYPVGVFPLLATATIATATAYVFPLRWFSRWRLAADPSFVRTLPCLILSFARRHVYSGGIKCTGGRRFACCCVLCRNYTTLLAFGASDFLQSHSHLFWAFCFSWQANVLAFHCLYIKIYRWFFLFSFISSAEKAALHSRFSQTRLRIIYNVCVVIHRRCRRTDKKVFASGKPAHGTHWL